MATIAVYFVHATTTLQSCIEISILHKNKICSTFYTKETSAQHEFIDHYILSIGNDIQMEIEVKERKLGIVTNFRHKDNVTNSEEAHR